jgi:hypothetical protein
MEDVTEADIDIYRAVDERDDGLEYRATVQTASASSQWDVSDWDVGMWDATRRRGVVRDKFLADSFALVVQNTSTVGPISIIGIKPIGN